MKRQPKLKHLHAYANNDQITFHKCRRWRHCSIPEGVHFSFSEEQDPVEQLQIGARKKAASLDQVEATLLESLSAISDACGTIGGAITELGETARAAMEKKESALNTVTAGKN